MLATVSPAAVAPLLISAIPAASIYRAVLAVIPTVVAVVNRAGVVGAVHRLVVARATPSGPQCQTTINAF